MKTAGSARNLLRPRGGHESGTVTYVGLFFDLVFVFAVTQLSHLLLHHFSLTGAFETLPLMLTAAMPLWTPLVLSLATTAILIAVEVWETVSLKSPGVPLGAQRAK